MTLSYVQSESFLFPDLDRRFIQDLEPWLVSFFHWSVVCTLCDFPYVEKKGEDESFHTLDGRLRGNRPLLLPLQLY